MKTISIESLVKKLSEGEDLNIIDVREDIEVAQGRIEQSVNIPLGQIPQRLEELNKDESYYFICRTNNRSGQACEFLEAKGYDVTLIDGGMTEWDSYHNN